MSTTDRIAVMQAIDAFCEMATNHPQSRAVFGGRTYTADTPGKHVTRIVMSDDDGLGRSVHCFVDNLTGDVFKAAGWKAPAKGVRYNLLTGFDEVERNFTWSGGYLYADHKRR